MELGQIPERLAALPLVLDGLDIEVLEQPIAIGGVRRTTLVRLQGGGVEGVGEDVTFQDDDRLCTQPTEAMWRGVTTLGDVWERLDQADLFDRPPRYEVVRNYRRWAIEAAALDLALRQANVGLAEVVGRSLRPLHFVVSPPPIHLRRFPGLRLKVDLDGVEPGLPIDVIDFKNLGTGELVRRAFHQYPEALFEDPPQTVDGFGSVGTLKFRLRRISAGYRNDRMPSTSSRHGSAASVRCSRSTKSADRAGSRCTVVASTSSAPGAPKSRFLPRSFMRTGPMMLRPRPTTRQIRRSYWHRVL